MLDRNAIDRLDDLACLQPGLGGRSTLDDSHDKRAAHPFKAERLGDIRGHRLEGGADIGTLEAGIAALGGGEKHLDQIGGDGKADAVRTAALGKDRRVDAEQFALHVHQRAAGIARIDRGVGLNEEAEITLRHPVAGERRDDTAGHRLADAEGIADRQHQVADLDLVAVADHQGRKLFLGVDLQHGEIETLVFQHDLDREFAAVGERHLDVVGTVDHVVVGDHHAVRTDNDTGAERGLLLSPVRHALAEELLEEGITGEGRDAALHHALGIDVDHRAMGLLDQRRKRHLHLGSRLGNTKLLREGRHRQRGEKRKRRDSQTTNDALHGLLLIVSKDQ